MAKFMKISFEGLEFLEKEEGCILHVYKDQAGLPTIGIGHLLRKSELDRGGIFLGGKLVSFKDGISREVAMDLLAQDLEEREKVLNSLIKVQVDQEQFDALLSFMFNIGNFGFESSTLLKELNAMHYSNIPAEMRKWNKITKGGRKVVEPGLKSRREREARLFSERKYS